MDALIEQNYSPLEAAEIIYKALHDQANDFPMDIVFATPSCKSPARGAHTACSQIT